jgi:hypothetical protein
LFAGALFAAPPLTTIQDTIYKADGTPFNGLALVAWRSFSASDQSNVDAQSVTVQIDNGHLWVQLVPTTTAGAGAYYAVVYNSDGRVQFRETWAVPPSTTALKLKDVRIVASSSGSSGSPPADTNPTGTPIPESDVTGLTGDLAARPVKAPTYLPSSVAFINAAGSLDAVAGSPSDCVHADGSTGPCGSTGPGFADGETPAGVVDGSNASFTLANVPSPSASLSIYRNGVLDRNGLDYSVSGAGVVFAAGAVPDPGDVLQAFYRTAAPSGVTGGVPQIVCSGAGASTFSASLTQIGSCTIPTNLLRAGDRFEIRFDYAHAGNTAGFTVQAGWSGTTLASQTAPASESIVTGRSDVAILTNGVQWNSQSWGASLSFAATAGNASFNANLPAVVELFGQMAGSTSETIALTNFTVLRYPGQ